MISMYMYFRLPPWHPERFFEAIGPFVSFLASKFFVLLLAIPAALGFLLAIRDFSQVRTVFLDTLSWAGAAKYFAAIILLKVIHEAAHSLAAIRFKCRVRGIGVGFMIFYPRLYTDTTDSWLLGRKQRLLIDAAGVIAELLAGGIAALFYFYLPPGPWQATMFYIFAVSTISTLLVNGNPCIRYDGYYILCDLTGIDNLMTRSGEYVKQFWRYYLLRLGRKPEHKHGWFMLLFGITSFIYRIFLYTAIIMVIYHKFIKVLAVILLILEIYTIFIYPCIREICTIRELYRKSAGKAGILLGTVLVIVLGVILFTPLNWKVSLDGMVVPARRVMVVAGEGGYLTGDLPAFPVTVRENTRLFTLESPQLLFAIDKMQAVLEFDRRQLAMDELDAENFNLFLNTIASADHSFFTFAASIPEPLRDSEIIRI
jgi:putative peptide zinc metalloprotease protein